MRIDLLLNKLCLTKTRSIAKTACDKGLVKLNGKPAKASAIVK
ncbi:MAG TPA: S4 domain-containing protein, partial [Candidatus Cloacimonadota bacterium]|nr:S4 domain-containing protein [Candidatus Cloacimonadota bacterium]